MNCPLFFCAHQFMIEVPHPCHRCFCLKYGFLLRIVNERQALPFLRYEKNSQECRAKQFPSHLRGGARGGVLQQRVISLIINDMQPHPQPLPLN